MIFLPEIESPDIIVIGTIDIDVTTNFNFYNIALAPRTTYYTDNMGQDIGTYVKTGENNDIRTVYVRIKYTVTIDDPSTEGIEEENSNRLKLVFAPNKETTTTSSTYDASRDGNKWFYNSSDNYYYYMGEVGETDIQFNKGYYVDNSLNNSIADFAVGITFEVEAIQRPYGAYKAVWSTAPDLFESFAQLNSGV